MRANATTRRAIAGGCHDPDGHLVPWSIRNGSRSEGEVPVEAVGTTPRSSAIQPPTSSPGSIRTPRSVCRSRPPLRTGRGRGCRTARSVQAAGPGVGGSAPAQAAVRRGRPNVWSTGSQPLRPATVDGFRCPEGRACGCSTSRWTAGRRPTCRPDGPTRRQSCSCCGPTSSPALAVLPGQRHAPDSDMPRTATCPGQRPECRRAGGRGRLTRSRRPRGSRRRALPDRSRSGRPRARESARSGRAPGAGSRRRHSSSVASIAAWVARTWRRSRPGTGGAARLPGP